MNRVDHMDRLLVVMDSMVDRLLVVMHCVMDRLMLVMDRVVDRLLVMTTMMNRMMSRLDTEDSSYLVCS